MIGITDSLESARGSEMPATMICLLPGRVELEEANDQDQIPKCAVLIHFELLRCCAPRFLA